MAHRVDAGQDGRVRGAGARRHRDGTLEEHSLGGQLIEHWSSGTLVAVGANPVGAQGIDRDQQHVRPSCSLRPRREQPAPAVTGDDHDRRDDAGQDQCPPARGGRRARAPGALPPRRSTWRARRCAAESAARSPSAGRRAVRAEPPRRECRRDRERGGAPRSETALPPGAAGAGLPAAAGCRSRSKRCQSWRQRIAAATPAASGAACGGGPSRSRLSRPDQSVLTTGVSTPMANE